MKHCLFFLVLLCPLLLNAYDKTQFDLEKAQLTQFGNTVVRDLLCSAISIRKSQPVLSSLESSTYCADLSFGQAIAPFFVYGASEQNTLLFGDPQGLYRDTGETMTSVNLGGTVSLPSRLIFTANLGLLPPMKLGNATQENFKVNLNTYYRLFYERFIDVGLFLGGGYNYTRGSVLHHLDVSYSDTNSSASFQGDMTTQWNYHALDLEVFIHKTFFVVNFYTRLNYYLMLGSVETALKGTYTGQSEAYSAAMNAPFQGIVTAGGMELILGEWKITAEAGRDWLSSSLYGSVGLRFGM